MRIIRPQKRSVSPFGTVATIDDSYAHLRELFAEKFPIKNSDLSPQLESFEDACYVPHFLSKLADAPANDAPELDKFCQFLLRYRESFAAASVSDALFESMQDFFNRKTELFMIDHHDRAHCERMGWQLEYRDVILYSKERDILIGRYFAPLTESQPGLFSEFISRWIESDNLDRVLHFLDFCMGSKNPTFEHYLLFTHPALARIISNKAQLRALLEKSKPLLSKLSSPTWEQDLHHTLNI